MITMMQKYDDFSDAPWKNSCQYFKVNGVEFPSCAMICNGADNEFIMSLKERKESAKQEVITALGDYPTWELFGSSVDKEEFEVFKKYLEIS